MSLSFKIVNLTVLFIVPLFFASRTSLAQSSFGPLLGTYIYSTSGVQKIDSIVVDYNDKDTGDYVIGVFSEHKLSKSISLLLKSKIRPVYTGQLVYNIEENCIFCPVVKASTVGIVNLSLELLPQIEIPFLSTLFPFLKFKFYIGPSVGINFVNKREPIRFAYGRHPGVAEVINALDDTIKPITVALAYGGSVEFKRIVFWVNVQYKSTFTDEILVYGKRNNFKNTWEFINFSIGYKFHGLKEKKGGEGEWPF